MTYKTDTYSHLAVLLSVLCGMWCGEIRGLQWGDIQEGYIDLKHNFQDLEGVKVPKWGSSRTIPLPTSVETILSRLPKKDNNSFILESEKINGKPIGSTFFRSALRRELETIGISVEEQKRRNITFHSLRHTFITLGRLAGISDIEIQTLAGHKDASMMNHYSHAGQVLDFKAAKEKLEKVLEVACE